MSEEGSLGQRAFKGSLWSLGGFGGAQVIRLASNLILTRLLFPEAFGLMVIVTAVLMGLEMLSDIGLGPSIIHNERGSEPGFLNTAWTLSVLRGALLFAFACGLAVPLSSFYEEPDLRWLVPAAAISVLFAGFNSTRMITENRDIRLRRITLIEIASQSAGVVVMISWALIAPSVTALVVGAVMQAATKLVLSHTALPGVRNRFHWESDAARAVLHFGGWIFISTLLTYLATQSDKLIFAGLIPADMLGVYGLGAFLVAAPAIAVGRIVLMVLFPLFSEVERSGAELGPMVHRARTPILNAGAWIVSCLIAGGPALIVVLYDPRWREAGWVVQYLAAGSWFAMLEATNGTVLLSRGQPRWIAAASAVKLLTMVPAMPLAYRAFGFPGAVAVFAAAEVFRYLTSVVGVRSEKIGGLRQDMTLTARLAVAAALGLAVDVAARAQGLGDFASGVCVFVAVTAVWAPALQTVVRSFRAPRSVTQD